jgi:hypothetical protein
LVSFLFRRVFVCTSIPSKATLQTSALMSFCALSHNKLRRECGLAFCAFSHKHLCAWTLNVLSTVINIATINYSARR